MHLHSRHPLFKAFLQKVKDVATLVQGVVCIKTKGRKAILCPSNFRDTLLRQVHDSPFGGHYFYDKTMHRLDSQWYWPGMANDVKKYIDTCETCNKNNYAHSNKPVPLQKMPTAQHFNDIVYSDLLGPLKQSNFCSYVLILVDGYSKLVELVPIPDRKAATVAQAILDHWILQHGVFSRFHSDLGVEYSADCMKELMNSLGAHHTFSSVMHPASNGVSERTVRNTLHYLRKYLN